MRVCLDYSRTSRVLRLAGMLLGRLDLKPAQSPVFERRFY